MDVIAMMRPNRLRIINLVAARARRKVAVKLTLMTSSQSSSRNCTNRLSRVMPALAIRISTWPMAFSADWNANRTLRDALDQAAQHLAGADFEKPDDTLACHVSHRLAPTHGSRDLLDQAAADFVRVVDRRGQYVRHQRRSRLLDRDIRNRFCHHIGCGLHQGPVKRRPDRQQP